MRSLTRREMLKFTMLFLTVQRMPPQKPEVTDFTDDELGIDENGIIIRPPLLPKVKP